MFIVDLSVHFIVLFSLVKTMPAPYFNGLLNGDDLSSSVYSLLAISFSVAIGVNGLKLHERRIKLRAVI